ncbi:hypothetical protein RHAL1_01870 [Beijerinckiaceae bacterium RH AL1]|nr:hypothetical protein [Beijerinckiaceae bacterium]VVB45636.1 hypothetical protein RHCH11_RHCH11_01832 [Beijerinckiaceae bacterium RH CH11]VVB45711.1 hypothetical protein RHAL8_01828 [Beijerinckiaceae bacterium RH AL8]VVC54964.1 hypothetical protein RHAL1_01870 [Beijerinckiaceae bacterium RH AL1]
MRLLDRFCRRFSLTAFGVAVGLATLAPAAQAESEMSFRVIQLGERGYAISARGQITNETPDRFTEFLSENPQVRGRPVVLLDSPGGRVLASMAFGKVLRSVGASAIVAGVAGDGQGGVALTNAQCFSACVYALMGASKRVIPSSSMIGIHRMFAYEADVDPSGEIESVHRRYDDGRMRSYLQEYSSEMGVSPGLISAAEHISSDHLKILSRGEIRRYHLGATR